MILEGRLVRFKLSPEGKVALKGCSKGRVFSLVASVDELGAWIDLGSKKRVKVGEPSVLVLLKWDYFLLRFSIQTGEPAQKRLWVLRKVRGARRNGERKIRS